MSALTIRPFTPEDAAAMAAIYGHYVKTSTCTFAFEVPSLEETRARYEELVAQGSPVLVGMLGDDLAGYAYATQLRPRPGYRFTCEDTIYLAPDAVGQGHGGRLLEALIAAARVCGYVQMMGVITADAEASLRLHTRHGFLERGRFPQIGHKFGRWLDIVYMQRAL